MSVMRLVMTERGVARLRYALVEVAPSRFSAKYAAWCDRADAWASGVNDGC